MVLMAVTENWLEFTLRYVVDYRERRVVRDRLFTRVLEEVNKTAGALTIASTTMEVTLAGHGKSASPEG